MSDENEPPFKDSGIRVDFETASILQEIEDADDDVNALAKIAERHPDKFNADSLEAYAKAIGKQDDPEIKALIQAVREGIGGPKP